MGAQLAVPLLAGDPMAQMIRCPHCGADNSARRAACYACGRSLASPQAEPAPGTTTAGDRFAAVIRERSRTAPDHPAAPAKAGPPTGPPSPSSAGATLPVAYLSLGQVRRAMMVFRQLHALVNSGIPLAQSLLDLAPRVEPSARRAVRAMAEHVAAGGRLSDPMRAYPALFLAHQVGLVQAGEMSGALPQALDEIAGDCETEYQVRKSIFLALLPVYLLLPVLLLVAPLALTLRAPMPAGGWDPLQLGLHYSHSLLMVALPAGLGLSALWALRVLAIRNSSLRAAQHRLSLALPLVGGVAKRMAVMRFLGSLSVLLNAGVPLADAFRTAAAATGNLVLSRQLLRHADNLYAGRGLADTLRNLRVISGTALDQLIIGETTGKLPEALARIAQDHRRSSERFLKFAPHLMQLVAYAVVVPVVFLVLYSLVSSFLEFRVLAPLRELNNIP